jgi:hypothetical protein
MEIEYKVLRRIFGHKREEVCDRPPGLIINRMKKKRGTNRRCEKIVY